MEDECRSGVVVMFSCTADILQKREKNPPREFIQLVKDHLASLDEELNSYFPDLKELDLKMIRLRKTCPVGFLC